MTIGRGRQPVLTGVSARIEPGEFIGVFGPNGAGKSTFFAALFDLCPQCLSAPP
ncbi:hypothetical protein GCM10022631_17590 [Deinococcus rubellus]|uniref:ATP-binding cassette domain-containing protein n=1 Tax=Deinococcus rubellus TaxID=1889240 RepID=UPI0031EEC083